MANILYFFYASNFYLGFLRFFLWIWNLSNSSVYVSVLYYYFSGLWWAISVFIHLGMLSCIICLNMFFFFTISVFFSNHVNYPYVNLLSIITLVSVLLLYFLFLVLYLHFKLFYKGKLWIYTYIIIFPRNGACQFSLEHLTLRS